MPEGKAIKPLSCSLALALLYARLHGIRRSFGIKRQPARLQSYHKMALKGAWDAIEAQPKAADNVDIFWRCVSSYFHLFVCTGPTCSQEGAEETLHLLQKNLKDKKTQGRVRVTLCRCLGQCGNGPNMVIYPEGTWYAHLDEAGIEQIVREHLGEGKIVARLLHDPVD